MLQVCMHASTYSIYTKGNEQPPVLLLHYGYSQATSCTLHAIQAPAAAVAKRQALRAVSACKRVSEISDRLRHACPSSWT